MLTWMLTQVLHQWKLFDAVGAGIDHQMADMPPDMSCADMAGDFPPPPGDFPAFMDECPPCGELLLEAQIMIRCPSS